MQYINKMAGAKLAILIALSFAAILGLEAHTISERRAHQCVDSAQRAAFEVAPVKPIWRCKA